VDKPFSTLEKVINILCLFDTRHPELSAQEIAQKVGMPLSTTYRYLKVLLNKQLLSKDESNKFFPGLAIVKLGLVAAERISVIDIAHPHLKALAASCLETVALTVLDGLGLICIDAIESPRPVKLSVRKGSVLPLYAGSPGKAVLAFTDQSFIDRVIETTGLVKLGKNTITDRDDLERQLALIRRLGFSESDSEFDLGVASVAAPIFDHKAKVIASISAAGPSDRIAANKPMLIEQVMETARTISSELGFGKNKENSITWERR
jgi:DNA-binding IclR family transcriptional regulator